MERFTATLGERGLVVPLDAKALWGEARPPVVAHVNGVEYRSRLMVYGGETWLGLTNAFRKQLGVSAGDTVEVELDRDDTPREVRVPPKLPEGARRRRRGARGVREALVHPPARVRGVDRYGQARGHARTAARPRAGDAARGREDARLRRRRGQREGQRPRVGARPQRVGRRRCAGGSDRHRPVGDRGASRCPGAISHAQAPRAARTCRWPCGRGRRRSVRRRPPSR